MTPKILFLLHFVFAAPTLAVQWAHGGDSVNVNFSTDDDSLVQCMKSGLEVRYRYDIKVCARQSLWFDDCTERYREIRTLRYDPVGDSYELISDVYSDDKRPSTVFIASAEEAQRALTQIKDLRLAKVAPEVPDLLQERKVYLSLRARGFCQEDARSLTTQIPYYLTFGMLRFTGSDSGWMDFSLER